MTDFNTGDLVEIRWVEIMQGEEQALCEPFWMPAEYVMRYNGSHVVRYADGKEHVLHPDIAIREADID